MKVALPYSVDHMNVTLFHSGQTVYQPTCSQLPTEFEPHFSTEFFHCALRLSTLSGYTAPTSSQRTTPILTASFKRQDAPTRQPITYTYSTLPNNKTKNADHQLQGIVSPSLGRQSSTLSSTMSPKGLWDGHALRTLRAFLEIGEEDEGMRAC